MHRSPISTKNCIGYLVYKALNGLAPDYLAQMFTERSRITYYTLRDTGDKLTLPQARTNYLKDSFSYSGAVLRNSLPNEVRQANTLSQFKTTAAAYFDHCKFLIVYHGTHANQVILRVLALLVLYFIIILYFRFCNLCKF